MEEYKHVISLGFACAVASETERIGLRSESGPFDWQANVSFKDRIKLMNSGVEHFLDYINEDDLWQHADQPWIYFIPKLGVHLVHDFNAYQPLEKQIERVKDKYQRRIKRFNNSIKERTLFIRYIYNLEELSWILENVNYINGVIKKYNRDNEIVYIANQDIITPPISAISLYTVKRDPGTEIVENFIDRSSEIKKLLCNLPFSQSQKKKNLYLYHKKQNHKKWTKLLKYPRILYWRFFKSPYKHKNRYDFTEYNRNTVKGVYLKLNLQ